MESLNRVTITRRGTTGVNRSGVARGGGGCQPISVLPLVMPASLYLQSDGGLGHPCYTSMDSELTGNEALKAKEVRSTCRSFARSPGTRTLAAVQVHTSQRDLMRLSPASDIIYHPSRVSTPARESPAAYPQDLSACALSLLPVLSLQVFDQKSFSVS